MSDLVKRGYEAAKIDADTDPRATLIWQMAQRIEQLEAQNAELNQVFDMGWQASMRAIKMWQEAHPGNDRVWPDAAHLEVWLMNRIEAREAALREIANQNSNPAGSGEAYVIVGKLVRIARAALNDK